MGELPNILFLLNDHQTYYGHGEMSGGPKIQRPNFERLAQQGIEFSHSYTACPLCGPARRTMLTGLFPHNHYELLNEVCYPFHNETYIEILSKAGYKNYYYGKWHAGPGTAKDLGCEGLSLPLFGNPLNTKEYKEYLNQKNLPFFKAKIVRSFWNHAWDRSKGIEVGNTYTPIKDNYDEGVFGIMETPIDTHESFFLAELACNKLKEISESENKTPFHLRVDFWSPHPPYFVTQDYLDLYNPRDIPPHPNFNSNLQGKPEIYKYDLYYPISKNGRLIYPNSLSWSEWQKVLAISYAHNTLVDHAGGRILDVLDKLGLSDNTIVVWTTDHGDGLGCHGGHFDKDCYMPEELLRIPLAIRFPKNIKSGQKSKKLVSNIDLAPTLLDAAGLSYGNPVDGQSLLPLCYEETSSWREDIMCETHGHMHIHLGRAIITDKYKYIYNERYMDELYDLENDPYELNNLINDGNYSKVIKDIQNRLKIWRARTNDTMKKKMISKIIAQKSH